MVKKRETRSVGCEPKVIRVTKISAALYRLRGLVLPLQPNGVCRNVVLASELK